MRDISPEELLDINVKCKNRQMGETLEEIREDHRLRYKFAADQISKACPAGSKVFDLGCGIGYGSFILADAGFKVVAVDVVKEVLEIGAVHYKHKNIDRRSRNLIDGVPKTWMRSPPAALTMFESMEHVGHLAARQCAEAGVKLFVGSVPNQLVVPWNEQKFPQHIRHYTPHELRNKLERIGWKVKFLGGQIGKRGKEAQVGNNAERSRTLIFVCET